MQGCGVKKVTSWPCASGLFGASLVSVIKADAIETIHNRLSVLSGLDALEQVFGVQFRSDGQLLIWRSTHRVM